MEKRKKVDHSKMKLGKQVPRHDPRTLQLANYLLPKALPPAPAEYMWGAAITDWTMMDNDQIGDCTCAAAGHLIMEWTVDNNNLYTPPSADIISAYSQITGYDPQTGANDNGAAETDVLNFWRTTGISGRQIYAYAALEPGNHFNIQQAVYMFGGCYIGLALPQSAQTQTVWSVPPGGAIGSGAPGSWGGHAVPIIGYDQNSLTVVTWGDTKQMTWEFLDAYCDESYAIISLDFISNNQSPNGFDLATLQADLQDVIS